MALGKDEKFWEVEQPEEARGGSMLFRYYPKAGRLQLSRLVLGDDGEVKAGKTVTLNKHILAKHPEALALLVRVLQGWLADQSQGAAEASEG